MCGGFAALCPTAAAEGVTLCYEGTLPADGVLALAERVSSPAFGCYFDLANPVVSGLDPATEARAARRPRASRAFQGRARTAR